MGCSLPGSSVHGVFFRQEYWSGLPFPFSRGSDLPRDQNHSFCVFCFARSSLPAEPSRKARHSSGSQKLDSSWHERKHSCCELPTGSHGKELKIVSWCWSFLDPYLRASRKMEISSPTTTRKLILWMPINSGRGPKAPDDNYSFVLDFKHWGCQEDVTASRPQNCQLHQRRAINIFSLLPLPCPPSQRKNCVWECSLERIAYC